MDKIMTLVIMDDAESLVEMSLLYFFIALAVITSLISFGDALTNYFSYIAGSVSKFNE